MGGSQKMSVEGSPTAAYPAENLSLAVVGCALVEIAFLVMGAGPCPWNFYPVPIRCRASAALQSPFWRLLVVDLSAVSHTMAGDRARSLKLPILDDVVE